LSSDSPSQSSTPHCSAATLLAFCLAAGIFQTYTPTLPCHHSFPLFFTLASNWSSLSPLFSLSLLF